MKAHTYRDLVVWQKALPPVVEVYRLTKKFPREEIYGLTSQMRRAAVSIPSNIAEGRLRHSDREFHQFLLIAFGSGGELESQIEIAKQLGFVRATDCEKTESLLDEVMRMLNVMVSRLAPSA